MKPKVGDVVRIRLYDHAENADDAIHFEVYGKLVKETKLAYKVASWLYVNEVDRAGGNHDNEHSFIIVKKAIAPNGIRVFK